MFLKELQDHQNNADLIYDTVQIKEALIAHADEINHSLKDLPESGLAPVVLPVMNGGLIYAGQLLPLITVPLQVDYIHATRYRNTTSGFDLDWKVKPQSDLKDRIVIILDDIFDEGITLSEIVEYCKEQGAVTVITAVLATKQHDRRKTDLKIDFSAVDVPDRYVFGYGMDFKGQLRNLNAIYALKEI